ncbi:MAG: hypothetical protein P4L87_20170, partial [Formivibrio sp.]|nr:hypothetical protein [Formivibrio sp.]
MGDSFGEQVTYCSWPVAPVREVCDIVVVGSGSYSCREGNSFCFFIIVGAHKNPTLWKYPAWSFKLGRLVKKIQKSQSEVFYLSAES